MSSVTDLIDKSQEILEEQVKDRMVKEIMLRVKEKEIEDAITHEIEEIDHCYECTGYGDDYYIDDNGELQSSCDECPFNSANGEAE